MAEQDIIKQRQESVLTFLKKNYNYVIYILLACIVLLAVRIRTLNLPLLKDVTTGSWTLGPDLDPFLFLRYAKYIVAHGSLFAVDTMRYIPIGFNTAEEYILHPLLISWFHNALSIFNFTESVTYSAIIYPVFFFALTVIAFFFLVQIVFTNFLGKKRASIVALISSFFLTIIPVLLPRTIAGIPEKESDAFFFLFATFYFFLLSWNSKTLKKQIIFAVLSALTTLAMALIWGGYIYIFLVISSAVLVATFLGKLDIQKYITFSVWFILSIASMTIISPRYNLINFLVSPSTGIAFLTFLIISVSLLLRTKKISELVSKFKFTKNIPREIISVLIVFIFGILSTSIFISPTFIFSFAKNVMDDLVQPAVSRLIQTVAENRQPFFTEWSGSFGPVISHIPIFFLLFFLGSIYLVFKAIQHLSNKKDKAVLLLSYTYFIFALVFSRYSNSGILNGTGFFSLLIYASAFIVIISSGVYYYYKYTKENNLSDLSKIDFGLVFIIAFFFFGLISARAAIRFVMVLVPPAAAVLAFVIEDLSYGLLKKNRKFLSPIPIISVIVIFLTLFASYSFYAGIKNDASVYGPTAYNQQWQKAMYWVRDSTPQDSVFAHWWDYGYWLQSIGERSTVLDGGNFVSYWNHLMGRYALTGTSNQESAEFLYSHNVTHFLIDSTDIGKYSAFSLIGSDVNYDRQSYLPIFLKDSTQTSETKDSKIYVFTGGAVLDEDIVYEQNGTKIFLPGNKAVIAAVLLEVSQEKVKKVSGVFIYNNNQYIVPLNSWEGSLDSGKTNANSVNSGVFLFPSLISQQGSYGIDNFGALIYLSPRTVNSQLARLYLYDEKNQYFQLAHTEQDFLVAQLKTQNPSFQNDFIYYQGFRGPIKIWQVSYPAGMQVNEEFLSTHYPEEIKVGK